MSVDVLSVFALIPSVSFFFQAPEPKVEVARFAFVLLCVCVCVCVCCVVCGVVFLKYVYRVVGV